MEDEDPDNQGINPRRGYGSVEAFNAVEKTGKKNEKGISEGMFMHKTEK